MNLFKLDRVGIVDIATFPCPRIVWIIMLICGLYNSTHVIVKHIIWLFGD